MQKPQKFAVRQPAAMLLQFADCSLAFLIEDVFIDIAVSHIQHPLRQMINELPRPLDRFVGDQRVVDIAADAVQHGELAHLFMSARPQCLGGSFVLCFIEVVTPVAFLLNFPERGSCLGRLRNDQRLLTIQEIMEFCHTHADVRASEIHPSILFNDNKASHINLLKQKIEAVKCPESFCEIRYSVKNFQTALNDELPQMKQKDCACLVIMDQFGVSEITADVLAKLDQCPKTDFMFFITSSFVKRFAEQKGIKERFNLKECSYHSVHRAVCEYYKSLLPKGSNYHLAPFSIRKKNGNIYGIIFGSHHLHGLEKFLKVCWNKDKVTGEANYDIDDDGDTRAGQMDLFGNDKIKKIDKFEVDLFDFVQSGIILPFLSGQHKKISVSNENIYHFSLENGFLPQTAKEILLRLKAQGKIEIFDNRSQILSNIRSLYLSHQYLQDDAKKLYFRTTQLAK